MDSALYKEACLYYARLEDCIKRAGFQDLDRDDIIDLMVIFAEDMKRLEKFSDPAKKTI